jgi:hypothetical protein
MSLKNVLDEPITIDDITYYGFNVYVISLDLYTSVSLKINVAFLSNGNLNSSALNDNTYNYKKQ